MMISERLSSNSYLRRVITTLASAVTIGLLIWSLVNYHIQPTQPIFYGGRAIYSILFLSIGLALLGQLLLLRILNAEIGLLSARRSQHNTTWRLLLLFDLTAPIYLAAGVLLGVFAAVLTALLTQLVVQGYTLWRGLISWTSAAYRVASTGVLVLVSTAVFQRISTMFPSPPPLATSYLESWELIATLLASSVMMVLLTVVSLPVIMQSRHMTLRAAWSEYFHSSVPRFQLLVLSVTPLLPVVDIFDNVVAELAWVFFLVPLLAIYYLALVSARLSLRTEELQNTLADLSSARRRQGELRDYASLITRVQEEERRRLARELHDDTAQALIALARGLDGLERAVEKLDLTPKDREWLANLQDLANRTLDGVRRACRDLRPSILDDLGLRAALEWLCDSSSNRGVTSNFTCTGTPTLTTPEAEIAIFRISQEALSNVWRHSQAMYVDVELSYSLGELRLHIRDNGCGFSPERISDNRHGSSTGLGLPGMRERAMLVNAGLAIKSQPGCGCTITLTLPLEEK
jgi:signal transduction histidine kinase